LGTISGLPDESFGDEMASPGAFGLDLATIWLLAASVKLDAEGGTSVVPFW
jgi:hypothetical protein